MKGWKRRVNLERQSETRHRFTLFRKPRMSERMPAAGNQINFHSSNQLQFVWFLQLILFPFFQLIRPEFKFDVCFCLMIWIHCAKTLFKSIKPNIKLNWPDSFILFLRRDQTGFNSKIYISSFCASFEPLYCYNIWLISLVSIWFQLIPFNLLKKEWVNDCRLVENWSSASLQFP